MKKIIGLSIAVIFIIAVVVGGTLAYFSDTETTTPNTFTAGIIDIEVSEDSNIIVSGEVVDLKPCMTGYKIVRIYATADSNPMEIWKKVNVLTDADRFENGVIEPEQAYYDANSITSPPGKNDIDRYIHFDMWIESDPESTPGTVTFGDGDTWIIQETDGWLLTSNPNTDETDLFDPAVIDPTDNGVTGKYIYIGTLQPNTTMVIVQSFHMDASVGNWAQSDKISFTEEFVAQQIEGSTLPPAPGDVGDVLPGHDRP